MNDRLDRRQWWRAGGRALVGGLLVAATAWLARRNPRPDCRQDRCASCDLRADCTQPLRRRAEERP